MSDNNWITVNSMIEVSDTPEIAEEVNKIIESITKCVERGEDRGKMHVFLDRSNKCQCGDVDLNKRRLQ